MDTKEIRRIFDETGALQNGHFLLSSGLHSPTYFQCAMVLQYPQYREMFCREIVEFFQEEEEEIDVVIGPAIGGIVVAEEVGRLLGVRSIFTERENGKMVLRRGFFIEPKENVLIVEDVLTTGSSVAEVVQIVERLDGYILGVGSVVDRSGGKVRFDIPVFSVYASKAVTYKPENCPLCLQKIPLSKPGSRYVAE